MVEKIRKETVGSDAKAITGKSSMMEAGKQLGLSVPFMMSQLIGKGLNKNNLFTITDVGIYKNNVNSNYGYHRLSSIFTQFEDVEYGNAINNNQLDSSVYIHNMEFVYLDSVNVAIISHISIPKAIISDKKLGMIIKFKSGVPQNIIDQPLYMGGLKGVSFGDKPMGDDYIEYMLLYQDFDFSPGYINHVGYEKMENFLTTTKTPIEIELLAVVSYDENDQLIKIIPSSGEKILKQHENLVYARFGKSDTTDDYCANILVSEPQNGFIIDSNFIFDQVKKYIQYQVIEMGFYLEFDVNTHFYGKIMLKDSTYNASKPAEVAKVEAATYKVGVYYNNTLLGYTTAKFSEAFTKKYNTEFGKKNNELVACYSYSLRIYEDGFGYPTTPIYEKITIEQL